METCASMVMLHDEFVTVPEENLNMAGEMLNTVTWLFVFAKRTPADV